MTSSDKPDAGQVQGEGDYVSARKFQKEEAEFASHPDEVAKKAKEAEAALEGPEAEELERARVETAKGHPKKD